MKKVNKTIPKPFRQLLWGLYVRMNFQKKMNFETFCERAIYALILAKKRRRIKWFVDMVSSLPTFEKGGFTGTSKQQGLLIQNNQESVVRAPKQPFTMKEMETMPFVYRGSDDLHN